MHVQREQGRILVTMRRSVIVHCVASKSAESAVKQTVERPEFRPLCRTATFPPSMDHSVQSARRFPTPIHSRFVTVNRSRGPLSPTEWHTGATRHRGLTRLRNRYYGISDLRCQQIEAAGLCTGPDDYPVTQL